ncbi:MAG: type I restriction-modification system subunit M [Deltaproteobacteria bacterium]|jgi:type I restriction enzyme M protein|nr:type I restriction-modification system subunit M [Deltaproteobacteria bacterium]
MARKKPPDEARPSQATLEKTLWEAADKLRKNIDAAEYKHVVLGLIFLKNISDSFDSLYEFLRTGPGGGADPEDLGEYRRKNVFFLPPRARWSFIQALAGSPDIGRLVDEAMGGIEAGNPSLRNVLPKVYARQSLDPATIGGLIGLIGCLAPGEAKATSADVLGHVFEYFLGQFALGEGRKGGQFYTPRSIVELLVEMLEPYEGLVFDPCCGSGGMFVQSEKFVKGEQAQGHGISIFGQESNLTTWRLAKMNLAIRGIDSSGVKWNSEGSFLRDAHPDLRADYVIANPPFNDSDWSGHLLTDDPRWQYGRPPAGNANFAWLQHFAFHLAPTGQAGIVLAKGALTSRAGGEGEIRRRMVEEGNIIDCVVNLPPKLFLNTQIPASLWFLARDRGGGRLRDRRGEILFIDARDMGRLINRRNRILPPEDIDRISAAYHSWRNLGGGHVDVAGFCRSVPIAQIRELDYALTPGRYVGLAPEEEDFDFRERFLALRAEFGEQLAEERRLNEAILENLSKILP